MLSDGLTWMLELFSKLDDSTTIGEILEHVKLLRFQGRKLQGYKVTLEEIQVELEGFIEKYGDTLCKYLLQEND